MNLQKIYLLLPQFIKNVLKFLFRRNQIHIEQFYKANLGTENPGLTGWVSRRFTPLRVVINGEEHQSVRINRPDAPHAFYLNLPNLKGVSEFTVESLERNSWKPYCKFIRKSKKPLAPLKTNPQKLHKAVMVHAYYPDILKEILPLLKNLGSHDAYVFIPEGSPMHQAYVKRSVRLNQFKKIIVGESKGRDMGGFLHIAQLILNSKSRYDACLVVHTKKSPQYPVNMANAWRKMLLDPLIGSKSASDYALQLLFSENDINLVGAQDFLQCYHLTRGFGNYSRYVHLCKLFEIPVHDTDFIAGSMFWVRFSVIRKYLTQPKLAAAIRLLEQGAFPEPSYAHTWERFIGLLSSIDGGKIKGIEYPTEFDIVPLR